MVARLLATEEFKLDWNREAHVTERERILVDEVQLQYFSDVTANQLQAGDRVILCMGKKVESGRKEVEVHSEWNVVYLEREVIQPSGDLMLFRNAGAA